MTTRLSLHLVVPDARAAIDFYRRALDATELAVWTGPDGGVVNAQIDLLGATVSLTESTQEGNAAPSDLGGSPVVIRLDVDDATAVGAAMEEAGATVVFPIADQFYGRREGRLRDPFGHLWMVGQQLEELSTEEIQQRIDAWSAGQG